MFYNRGCCFAWITDFLTEYYKKQRLKGAPAIFLLTNFFSYYISYIHQASKRCTGINFL